MSILLSALLPVLRLVRAAALHLRLGLPVALHLGLPIALILVFAVVPTAAPAFAAVTPAAGRPTTHRPCQS